VPAALLLALLLLLGFEVGVARSDWIWGWVPHSDVGVVDALESQVISDADQPQILFMGSSRIRDAVSPRLLEHKLGLDEGAVLNLGLTKGTPFSAEKLYERNRSVLSSASVVVFGLESWQFTRRSRVNERVNRFASLEERLRYFDGPDRLPLIVGAIWRTYDARAACHRFFKTWFVDRPPGLPITDDGRVRWRTLDEAEQQLGKRSAGSSAKLHWKRWSPSAGRFALLGRFVDRVQADGIDVWLVEVPTQNAYLRVVEDNYPEKLEHDRAQVERVANGAEVTWMGSAADVGMRDADFFDYGHVNEIGAAQTTGKMAQIIRERYGEP
jgi:hypothetical protein